MVHWSGQSFRVHGCWLLASASPVNTLTLGKSLCLSGIQSLVFMRLIHFDLRQFTLDTNKQTNFTPQFIDLNRVTKWSGFPVPSIQVPGFLYLVWLLISFFIQSSLLRQVKNMVTLKMRIFEYLVKTDFV